MPKIEVSQEHYDFLMELSKEMNTQDERGTQNVMFTAFQHEKIYRVEEGCGDEMVTEYRHETDGEDPIDWEDLIAEINMYNEDVDSEESGFVRLSCYSHSKHMCEGCLGESHPQGNFMLPTEYEEITHVVKEFRFIDNFFTDKAAQRHIDSNHYHYQKPYVWGSGSWRNPEMQTIQAILKSLNPVKEESKS